MGVATLPPMKPAAWLVVLVISAVPGVGVAQTTDSGVPPAHSQPAVVTQQQDAREDDVAWRPGLEKTSPVEPRNRQSKWRWYGEPILIGDATAYTCLLLAVAFDMTETTQVFVPPALLGYALVGPITHVVHGNWGRMSLSLLTRGVLPIVGLALGAGGCNSGGGNCVESVLAGGTLGMVVASSLDVGLIAREPVPRPRVQAWLAPALELGPDRAVFGALGAF
jgi:hypothetical protein